VVLAESASKEIKKQYSTLTSPKPAPPWDESQVSNFDEEIVVTHNWDELRRAMWDYVGIVRTNKRLARAEHRINLLNNEIQEYYAHFKVSKNLIELRNLVQVAELIVASAMKRKESRGLHYNLDYPKPHDTTPPVNTILQSKLA